jgi:DNA transformation protein and related proteins
MAIPGEQWKGYPLLPLPMRGGTPLKCVASKGPCVMAVTVGYKEFLEDLLASFGPVSIRNMFSGAGVYADGVMFAILVNDTLYLRADAVSARDFAAEGKAPFASRRKGRAPIAMSYWEVPDRLLEDPEELGMGAARATPSPLPLPLGPSQNGAVRGSQATEPGCSADIR